MQRHFLDDKVVLHPGDCRDGAKRAALEAARVERLRKGYRDPTGEAA